MLMPLFLITLAAATLAALVWAGAELFRGREDPLAARLEELQAHAMSTGRASRTVRHRGGFLNSLLYLISLVPGGEEYLRDTEEELAQGGDAPKMGGWRLRAVPACIPAGRLRRHGLFSARQRWTLRASWGCGCGRDYWVWRNCCRGKCCTLACGAIVARLAIRSPGHGADLLGVVLGTGLALDQAMLRVSEEMEFIYPELAAEFATVVMQVKAGQERAKAFRQLVRRTGIEDIKALAAMIVQSDERFGTKACRKRCESICGFITQPPPAARGDSRRQGGNQDAVPHRAIHPSGAVRSDTCAGRDYRIT